MEAQEFCFSKEMIPYLPLKVFTYTGNKGIVSNILTDKSGCIMAFGFVASKTHGNIPVAWNIHGESIDRVSSLSFGNIRPTKDLCIKEIVTKIPEEPKETNVFEQAFDAMSKANSIESKNEKHRLIDTLPQEIQAHLNKLIDELGDGVEVKAYIMDSEGNLVSINKPENETVH